jgi:hypothetical protein
LVKKIESVFKSPKNLRAYLELRFIGLKVRLILKKDRLEKNNNTRLVKKLKEFLKVQKT